MVMDSPHKGAILWKSFPWYGHGVVVLYNSVLTSKHCHSHPSSLGCEYKAIEKDSLKIDQCENAGNDTI